MNDFGGNISQLLKFKHMYLFIFTFQRSFGLEKGEVIVGKIKRLTFSGCRCVWWPWQRNDWPGSRPATAAAG